MTMLRGSYTLDGKAETIHDSATKCTKNVIHPITLTGGTLGREAPGIAVIMP